MSCYESWHKSSWRKCPNSLKDAIQDIGYVSDYKSSGDATSNHLTPPEVFCPKSCQCANQFQLQQVLHIRPYEMGWIIAWRTLNKKKQNPKVQKIRFSGYDWHNKPSLVPLGHYEEASPTSRKIFNKT